MLVLHPRLHFLCPYLFHRLLHVAGRKSMFHKTIKLTLQMISKSQGHGTKWCWPCPILSWWLTVHSKNCFGAAISLQTLHHVRKVHSFTNGIKATPLGALTGYLLWTGTESQPQRWTALSGADIFLSTPAPLHKFSVWPISHPLFFLQLYSGLFPK